MARSDDKIALNIAYDELRGWDPTEPEKSLMRAMLMTAISDLKKEGHTKRKAREYFLNAEDDYVLSFRSICSYLNINSQSVLYAIGLNSQTFVTEKNTSQREAA